MVVRSISAEAGKLVPKMALAGTPFRGDHRIHGRVTQPTLDAESATYSSSSMWGFSFLTEVDPRAGRMVFSMRRRYSRLVGAQAELRTRD